MDARKRGRAEAGADGNGAATFGKRFKEMDSNQPGLGSKSKPCTKFFSTAGCPFGEGCHFLHYVPGGIAVVSQMTNLGNPATAPGRNFVPAPAVPNVMPSPGVKNRMCNKYNTAEGCKFGDKCHFAHGERELGNPAHPSHIGRMAPQVGGRMPSRMEPPFSSDPYADSSFGLSATAKISIDASLSGAIIGKGGVNTKQICRITGVKLAIREHELDPNLKNIELEGTFDQINHASAMVKELIRNVGTKLLGPVKNFGAGGAASNFKTKLCENFTKASCTFGDRCHFAHGEAELRKAAV